MSSAASNEELDALLKWFNLIPPRTSPSHVDDLRTGSRIWDVLQRLDPNYFNGDLPETQTESSKWLSRWQNLKHISRNLDRYVTSVGFSIPMGLDAASIDLKSTANGEDVIGTGVLKLLKMVLLAALRSPNIEDFVAPMQNGLDTKAQTALVTMITQLQNEAESSEPVKQIGVNSDTHAPGEAPEIDQALLYEQRLSKITAQRDELLRDKQEVRKELHDLEYRHSRLQENNDILQQKLVETEDRLKEGQGRGSEEPTIRRLEGRVQSQDDIIAGQEAQLSEYQERVDGCEKEITRLRKETARLQPLQDELDETRVQKDAFAKRANMADKYQQKLMDLSELEKENQLLKGELEEAKFEKGDGSTARTQIAGLQRTLDEYRATLPAIERERHELQMMLKQMERDNSGLGQELELTKEQLTKAQEQISDLRTGRPMSPLDEVGSGLASEIENSEKREALEALPAEERSRKLFKSLEDANTELFLQKQLLEDQEKKYEGLEKRYELLHSKKTALERESSKSQGNLMELDQILPDDDDATGNGDGNDEASKNRMNTQDAEIAKLKERIKFLEMHNPTAKKAADAAALKQEIKVLRQENKLISTAWYDLNSRTHLNNVILQRKNGSPHGFLRIAREMSDRAIAIRIR